MCATAVVVLVKKEGSRKEKLEFLQLQQKGVRSRPILRLYFLQLLLPSSSLIDNSDCIMDLFYKQKVLLTLH